MKRFISCFFAVFLCFGLLCTASYADGVTEDMADAIRAAAENYEPMADVTHIAEKYGWDYEQVKKNIGLGILCNPDLFYISTSVYMYYGENGTYGAMLSYTVAKENLKKAYEKFDSVIEKIIDGITDDMSDVEKALYVHDYIILNCSYDTTMKKRSSYNCLVNRSSVCQGYSLAYMYILNDYLGIDCTLVYSDSQNHLWNYVKIDNNWYHVDLTIDDECSSYKNVSRDNFGYVNHANFLMSDSLCKSNSGLHRNWKVVGGFGPASDKSFDKSFWRSSRSPICRYDGKWYYAVQKKANGNFSKKHFEIRTYDFASGKDSLLKVVEGSWYAVRRSDGTKVSAYGKTRYSTGWLGLAVIGDYIYFNTNKDVYKIDLNSGRCKKIYTLKKDTNQIFGIMPSSGKLKVAYRYDITYSENYINIKIK